MKSALIIQPVLIISFAASLVSCGIEGSAPRINATLPERSEPESTSSAQVGVMPAPAPQGAAIPYQGRGGVNVRSSPEGTSVMAGFVRRGRCPLTRLGPCEIEACAPATEPSPAAHPHAGLLEVEGGAQDLSLSPRQDGWYVWTSPAPFFGGDDPLTVSTTGDIVPPFSMTLAAPESVEITSPLFTPGVVPELDRAGGLTVTWLGGGADTSVLVWLRGKAGANTLTAQCAFDTSNRSGHVPAAVLERLLDDEAQLTALARNRADVTLQGWEVYVSLEEPARQWGAGPERPVWTGNLRLR